MFAAYCDFKPGGPRKFGLIAVAGVNVAIFHNGVYRTVADSDLGRENASFAMGAALVSASTLSSGFSSPMSLRYTLRCPGHEVKGIET
jgi:hypothetical protein